MYSGIRSHGGEADRIRKDELCTTAGEYTMESKHYLRITLIKKLIYRWCHERPTANTVESPMAVEPSAGPVGENRWSFLVESSML